MFPLALLRLVLKDGGNNKNRPLDLLVVEGEFVSPVFRTCKVLS